MKNFPQNLLIFLALCLCGLCAYQWYFETLQRARLDDFNKVVYEKTVAIQGYTNSLREMDQQIALMDQQLTVLRTAAKSNDQILLNQKRDLARLESANELLNNGIAQYKDAVSNLESKLQEAYEGISKQNKAVSELVAQRDEFVRKYNESVKDRNDLTVKYNQLVERIEKLQTNASK